MAATRRRLRAKRGGDLGLSARFDEKFHELDRIKNRAMQNMKNLNALRVRYSEWFVRQNQSFLDVLKTVQIRQPTLVPSMHRTIANFKSTHQMAHRFASIGCGINGLDKLDQFLAFWTAYTKLHAELDACVTEVDAFVRSIAQLRVPQIKDEIDLLCSEINVHSCEDFDFTDAHNEKENLYTYRVMVGDHQFLGLVGYLPHLLKRCTELCYLIGKLYVEKE